METCEQLQTGCLVHLLFVVGGRVGDTICGWVGPVHLRPAPANARPIGGIVAQHCFAMMLLRTGSTRGLLLWSSYELSDTLHLSTACLFLH